jgi:DNA polymerase I-like protein with 3'-5' exonuclease and polymerase domains
MFCASTGFVLVSADYMQLELRMFAHLSRDALLLDVFGCAGDGHAPLKEDVFRVLASRWLKKELVQVSPEDRKKVRFE